MHNASVIMFIGMLVFTLGSFLATIGTIWLLIVAFQQSLAWGLASLLIPFASIFFAIRYWSVAQTPFILSLMGGLIAMVGCASAYFAVLPASAF